MNKDQRNYASFLLRLWRVESSSGEVWRASLEDPMTNKRKGFANIEALILYLKSSTGEVDPAREEEQQNLHFTPSP